MVRTIAACGLVMVMEWFVCNLQAAGPWPELNPNCPRSGYSRLNYLAPSLFRCQAHCQRPGPYLYATDHYPDVPIHNQPIVFPCPAVSPSARPYPVHPPTVILPPVD